MDIEQIVKNFKFEGNFIKAYRYGSGHINESYKVECTGGDYILQKINSNLFKDVNGLMNNISLVLDFSKKEIINANGNPNVECMTIVKTIDGNNYYKDEDGGYYRAYVFISEGIGYDKIENPEHFYASGVAFGKFQKMLSRFDASKLVEILQDFHNTRVRFNNFIKAVKEDTNLRVNGVKNEIEFALSREKYVDRIVDLLKSGKMPLRVTHNDTKLNNVLISSITNKAVCVIDLDTIMPGSILYDFGDSIRFGANHSVEDEIDLSKVNFDIQLFDIFAKGFLGEVGKSLTEIEIKQMAFGAILMTFECGIRFLTDYLQGDTYFRTTRKNQNLDRTRTQFKLVFDMEKNLDEMNKIVKNYI